MDLQSSTGSLGPASGTEVELPSLLSPIVHQALLALGQARGIAEHASTIGYDHRPLSGVDRRLQLVCREAAEYLLSGFSFDFGRIFFDPSWKHKDSQEIPDLNRLRAIHKPLTRTNLTYPGWERATAVYERALEAKGTDMELHGWKHLSRECKDRLARNVQDLEWCNTLWKEFLASGAKSREIVHLFSSVVMTAMRVRFPIQDFPSQWWALGTIRTLDELKLIGLSASIRAKPNWRQKIEDSSIVAKWREEAYEQDVTPSMFDFLIAEARWFGEQFDPETGIGHATVPGVFVSDSLVSLQDTDALRAGAIALAAVPERQKDWHPNSNEQVLDLVHPSLYPYVRGRTCRHLHEDPSPPVELSFDPTWANMEAVAVSVLRFLSPPSPQNVFSSPLASIASMGRGVPTIPSSPLADIVEHKWKSNSVYQWLPVDVEISEGPAQSARFLSYINNLRPGLSGPGGTLYPVLERILASFIPIFEHTLTETRRRPTGNEGNRTEFLLDGYDSYWDPPPPGSDDGSSEQEDMKQEDTLPQETEQTDGQQGATERETSQQDKRQQDETEQDEMDEYELFALWRDTRQFVRPVVKPFVAPGPAGQAQVNLRGRILQVIVKMANVHLTPEKPEYAGGSWHVEGTDNERIVATGIYYFESENITESSLSFRQAFEEPDYGQGLYDHLEPLYGIESEGVDTNQNIGAVVTPQGRCICFPNGMQHRLSSFKLIDPTKSGHRKILVFFLVDPSERILSTTDVPPQQPEWLLIEIRARGNTRLSSLPLELFRLICEYVNLLEYSDDFGECSPTCLMTLAEAKEHRRKLMAERAQFVEEVNNVLYERSFLLCEH